MWCDPSKWHHTFDCGLTLSSAITSRFWLVLTLCPSAVTDLLLTDLDRDPLFPSYVIQPSSMEAKPSKQKFWLQRSHSFSGAIPTKSNRSAVAASSATVYAPIRTKRDVFPGLPSTSVAAPSTPDGGAEPERIGRFKLKRYSLEKKGGPVSLET